jgi:microcystin-dependent protein
MFCEGQLLAIAEFETLFNLIGTTYGGDGTTNFALPDLRGRLPIHQGNGFTLAETGGVETVTLTLSQIPNHTHPPACNSGPGNQQGPGNGVWAAPSAGTIYSSALPTLAMEPTAAVGVTGGSQPHNNFMPYLCVDFIISMFGIFPTQT